MAAKSERAERGARAFVGTWVEVFSEHNLLTWASAIAFQALIALVPLTLLLLGVLGALDESSVWKKQISPGLKDHLPKSTFDAVNYAADRTRSNRPFSPGVASFRISSSASTPTRKTIADRLT